jgi:hypothetical protein
MNETLRNLRDNTVAMRKDTIKLMEESGETDKQVLMAGWDLVGRMLQVEATCYLIEQLEYLRNTLERKMGR